MGYEFGTSSNVKAGSDEGAIVGFYKETNEVEGPRSRYELDEL